MNGVTTAVFLHVWQNPFAGLQKKMLGKIASVQNAFEDVMPAAVLIGAIIVAFSGILDMSFFQELFSGLLSGSFRDSGFFKSLPLNY